MLWRPLGFGSEAAVQFLKRVYDRSGMMPQISEAWIYFLFPAGVLVLGLGFLNILGRWIGRGMYPLFFLLLWISPFSAAMAS